MPQGIVAERGARLHPTPIRIMHWVNAIAMIIMIGSGWRIYGDDVIVGWINFPAWASLGGSPEISDRLRENSASGALQWHFAGMWVLAVNGLLYLAYGLITGRFRRKLLPVSPREVLHEVGEALSFRLGHGDITMYNAVQKVLYIGVILAGIVQVVSGLAMWKPVQFDWLVDLMGGFQSARVIHFLGMAAIVGFLIVHVTLALLVPKTLVAMVTGGPVVGKPAATKPGAAAPMPAE